MSFNPCPISCFILSVSTRQEMWDTLKLLMMILWKCKMNWIINNQVTSSSCQNRRVSFSPSSRSFTSPSTSAPSSQPTSRLSSERLVNIIFVYLNLQVRVASNISTYLTPQLIKVSFISTYRTPSLIKVSIISTYLAP